MYRQMFVCVMVACSWNQCALSQTMTVHTKSAQQSFEISEIDSITFTGGSNALVADWVSIPAGPYTSGQGDTSKTIPYSYSVMKYEVTNAQYMQYLQEALAAGEITISGTSVMGQYPGDAQWAAGTYVFYELGTNTSSYKYGQINYTGGSFQLTPVSYYANHPVIFVTWFGAWAFVKHYNLRLPTEEEWEKAARGNTGNDYPWGTSVAQGDANYSGSSDTFSEGSTPVGYYNGLLYGSLQTTNRPSPYGAYDMAGNAWEWTDSFYGDVYSSYRVMRGGGWNYSSFYLQSWVRYPNNPTNWYINFGFRCARTD